MNMGRAADCAEHFTDTHRTNGVLTLPTDFTWKKFIDLLNETFDLRKTKDKARVDLSILKHRPGKLEEYIMDFMALASQAGYILAGDAENPILSQIFLKHLNPQLRKRSKHRKNYLRKSKTSSVMLEGLTNLIITAKHGRQRSWDGNPTDPYPANSLELPSLQKNKIKMPWISID